MTINTKIIWKLKDNIATVNDLNPNLKMLLNEIFKPMPAMATTNNNLLDCCNINNIFPSMNLSDTNTDIIINPAINGGMISTLDLFSPDSLNENKPNNNSIGPNIMTLIIFINVAYSPTFWLIINPVAVTCPTAWTVEPIINPDCSLEK